MSVDLPEPDEPMIATNSPDWTVRLIPRSASTLTSPRIKVRATFSTLMTGCVDFRAFARHRSTISKARRRRSRLAAHLTAAFSSNDLIARVEIALDDLGEVVVIETGSDGAPQRADRRAAPRLAAVRSTACERPGL